MSSIKEFNKQNLKEIREMLNKALAGIHPDLIAEAQNASFTSGEVTFKLNIKIKGAKSRAASMLEEIAGYRGIDITKTSADGYKLVGYESKKRTRPWVVEKVSTGKRYVMSDMDVSFRWPNNRPLIPIKDFVPSA